MRTTRYERRGRHSRCGRTLTDLNQELVRRWGVQLDVRTGVNTGEVVVGETPGGAPTTLGDTVNVAQRLENAAPPGQVLIGEETARLVRANAQLAPMDALTLKGKAAPVPAWRLVSISSGTSEAPDRAMTPFVGREAELRLLRDAFDEVVATLGRPPRHGPRSGGHRQVSPGTCASRRSSRGGDDGRRAVSPLWGGGRLLAGGRDRAAAGGGRHRDGTRLDRGWRRAER